MKLNSENAKKPDALRRVIIESGRALWEGWQLMKQSISKMVRQSYYSLSGQWCWENNFYPGGEKTIATNKLARSPVESLRLEHLPCLAPLLTSKDGAVVWMFCRDGTWKGWSSKCGIWWGWSMLEGVIIWLIQQAVCKTRTTLWPSWKIGRIIKCVVPEHLVKFPGTRCFNWTERPTVFKLRILKITPLTEYCFDKIIGTARGGVVLAIRGKTSISCKIDWFQWKIPLISLGNFRTQKTLWRVS